MTWLDFSLIYFLINVCVCFVWILWNLLNWKIEKYKSYNSVAFFSKKPLMHKFFIKYSLFANFLKLNFLFPIVPILLYAFWLDGFINYYTTALDLFIGFNIGFILIIFGSILFLLFLYIKLTLLKKEFIRYRLKILKNADDIELFKLLINNVINAVSKSQHYQKMFNKVKKIIANKKELQGGDLLKFLIKNFNIWTSFYCYLYSCRKELNLDFKFKESVWAPNSYSTYISFFHGIEWKDLYGKEVYKIFTDYLNSFEFVEIKELK